MSYDLAEIEPEMASELTMPQMELLLGDDRPKIDYSKPEFGASTRPGAFSYNAARLWRDRADVAKAACKLLAEPREVMPYRRIMKRLHMSYHLLRQLEISSAGKIAEEKKTLGDLAYTATEVFLERAISVAQDEGEKISGKDAMIAAGIGAEKFMMFRGEAGQKIDLSVTLNFRDELRRLNEEAMAKLNEMKRVTGTVIEAPNPPPTPGSGAACKSQIPSGELPANDANGRELEGVEGARI